MDVQRQLVLVEDRPEARILTLNRPEKLNAVDNALNAALIAQLREAAEQPALRAIVLTGAGRAFCAGGDLELLRKRMTGEPDPVSVELHASLMRDLKAIEVPLIAAMNGFALGVGAEIVAYCDIVVMSQDAWLCEPHASFGLGPLPGVRDNWRTCVSRVMLNELVLTARRLSADEALRLGLVNRIAPTEDVLDTALSLATEIAQHPLIGIKACKEALRCQQ
jgi:enoyl-CoA hydratase